MVTEPTPGAIAPADDLGPEWMLLELLCRGPLEGPAREQFLAAIRRGAVDYGTLLQQAVRHRLLMLLAAALNETEIAAVAPPQLSGQLLVALLANRERIALLTRSLAEVMTELEAAGVRAAATKGAVLERTVYGGFGLRQMNDVDLVIHPDDRAEAARVMAALGFVHGVYLWREHRIAELPARTRAKYRISPDHLPHYLRLEASGGVTVVDVANSLTWSRSEWQVDMRDVIAQRDEISTVGGDTGFPALTPAFLFLSTVLHLFRESWFYNSAEQGKDALYKFADVLWLWRTYRKLLHSELPGLIERFNLARPLGWVLTHTDRMFGTRIATDLGLLPAVSEDWLVSAGDTSGRNRTWRGSMRERLHAGSPRHLFASISANSQFTLEWQAAVGYGDGCRSSRADAGRPEGQR